MLGLSGLLHLLSWQAVEGEVGVAELLPRRHPGFSTRLSSAALILFQPTSTVSP